MIQKKKKKKLHKKYQKCKLTSEIIKNLNGRLAQR
jgi:hypothetical protein